MLVPGESVRPSRAAGYHVHEGAIELRLEQFFAIMINLFVLLLLIVYL